MMSFPKLNYPPIKEIIFTISYNEIIDDFGLEKFVEEPKIKQEFKLVGRTVKKQIDINNHSSEAKINNLHDGFILTSNNNEEVIQIKKGSFSFHKIESYKPFNELYDSLISYWELLDKSTKDHLVVNNISIRYVNLIPKSDSEAISDLLTIFTENKFTETTFNNRNQIAFKYSSDDNILANIFTAYENNNDGIILDISLSKQINEKDSFYDDLKLFRDIKNDIFFKCITLKAQNKFNYE